MDSEKDEMNQEDIAALHHFYSKHISDLPSDQALIELFTQVHKWITLPLEIHPFPGSASCLQATGFKITLLVPDLQIC